MRLLLCAIGMSAALASPACAQTPADTAVPYDGLGFDDAKHRRWYARFWTGRCDGLSLFVCFSGKPFWHETIQRLVATVPPERREALRRKLFALGRTIGHEWGKENDLRKISTDHIRAWYALMERGGDTEAIVARIEAEAHRLLASR